MIEKQSRRRFAGSGNLSNEAASRRKCDDANIMKSPAKRSVVLDYALNGALAGIAWFQPVKTEIVLIYD